MKGIQKKLDDIWREIVKLQWHKRIGKDVCAVPGCGNKGTNCHHIFTRIKRSTRWEPLNGIVLCAGHHTMNIPSAHKLPPNNPNWFKDYVLHVYLRQTELDWLEAQSKILTYWKEPDLEKKLKELRELRDKLL